MDSQGQEPKTLLDSLIQDDPKWGQRPHGGGALEGIERLSGRDFSTAILASKQFREYVVRGIVVGNLPPQVVLRLMDHGWGVPKEKAEEAPTFDEFKNATLRELQTRGLQLANQARELEKRESPPPAVEPPSEDDGTVH